MSQSNQTVQPASDSASEDCTISELIPQVQSSATHVNSPNQTTSSDLHREKKSFTPVSQPTAYTSRIVTRSQTRMQHSSEPPSSVTDMSTPSEPLMQLLLAMQQQNQLIQQQLSAEKNARTQEKLKEQEQREAWERAQREQWEADCNLRKELQALQMEQAEKLETERQELQEKLRQQKAASDIPRMEDSEAILAYFERVECAFISLGITVDKHKLDVLRSGLQDSYREVLLNITGGMDITYDVAKAQVLIGAGFSLHQNVMHFAPIGPTSNEPSRWFKEKAFRLRKLYDHPPLEGDYESRQVDGIINRLCASMLPSTLPPDGIDKVLSHKNKTRLGLFNAFTMYIGEHPYSLKRNQRYFTKSGPHDKASHFDPKRRQFHKSDHSQQPSKHEKQDTSSGGDQPNKEKASKSTSDDCNNDKVTPTSSYCGKRGHKTVQCFQKKRHQKEGEKEKRETHCWESSIYTNSG